MDSPPPDDGGVVRRHGTLVERLATLRSDESFHFVFSNRTHSDPYAVSLHTELTKRGLRVWQQRMNIPKDSDNWFSEWYPAAAQARKIICFLTAAYMKSPFCMKEWRVAESKHKLLVVVLEPMEQLRGVNPAEFPHASNALAYLDGGGQVIFHDTDDVVGEVLKFTDGGGAGAELMPGLAIAGECEPEPALGLGGLGSPPPGTGPQRGGAAAATAATAVKTDETAEALLGSVRLAAYVAFFEEEGYVYVSDLLDAAEEDIDELVAGSKMKKPEQKRFRKVLASAAAAGGGGAKPGARDEAAEAEAVVEALQGLEAQRMQMEEAAAKQLADQLAAQKAQFEEQAVAQKAQMEQQAALAAAQKAKVEEDAAAQKAALEAQLKAQQDAASAALAQQLQQEEELEQRRRRQPAAAAAAEAAAPEPFLPVLSEAAAVEMAAAAQPEAAADGRVVVRDAAALRAAVADGGGAPVVELDPAGGVFALGTGPLDIHRPVRLVSGAGRGATLAGGEGGRDHLVRVYSPGVALEGLALVAGTDGSGDQPGAIYVHQRSEAELRGCDVTGIVDVWGTAALHDCAVHDVTCSSPCVYVSAASGAGRATLERCAIERCAGKGVLASSGAVVRLVETTVRECKGDDYCTMSSGVIEGVAPGLITKC